MNNIEVDSETFLSILSKYCFGSDSDKAIFFNELKRFINNFDTLIIRNKDYEMTLAGISKCAEETK